MSERKPWWETTEKDPLNWEIEERPVLVKGFKVPHPGVKALVADGKVLDLVGAGFPVVQPKELVQWAKSIRFMSEVANPLRSWALRDGQVIGVSFVHSTWPLRTVGGPIDLTAVVHAVSWNGGGGREIYLDVVHDGLVYPVDKAMYVAPKVDVAASTTYAEAYIRSFGSRAQTLANRPATLKTLSGAIETVWPKPSESAGQKSQTRWKTRKDEIITTWQELDDDGRSTSWGVLTAVNEWAQYGRWFRGSGGDEAANDRLRGEETLLGKARRVGLAAWDHLL